MQVTNFTVSTRDVRIWKNICEKYGSHLGLELWEGIRKVEKKGMYIQDKYKLI